MHKKLKNNLKETRNKKYKIEEEEEGERPSKVD
jgi:hypothetical protein